MVMVIVFFLLLLLLVVYDFVVVDFCLLFVFVCYFDMQFVFVYVGFDYDEFFFLCIREILVFVEGVFGSCVGGREEDDVWLWYVDGDDVVMDECDVF